MPRPHVAFVVEPAHGHINPILGVMAELVNREVRVTCAVNEYFADRVSEVGAEPIRYRPLTYKAHFVPRLEAQKDRSEPAIEALWAEYEREERRTALMQLEGHYRGDRPNLIVYDFRNLAGRDLALKWGVAKLEHAPILFPAWDVYFGPHDENLVIVSVPRFFQENVQDFDDRFRFVGASYKKRGSRAPWVRGADERKIVLACGSTGGSPPLEFFKAVATALSALNCRVVLSIGDELDPGELGRLPPNCDINRFASHLDILESSVLFIGQGGPASTLEALYCGVPALIVPPEECYDHTARQVERLGVGVRLPPSPRLVEGIRAMADNLLTDRATRERTLQIKQLMRSTPSAKLAADLIESYRTTGVRPARESSHG